MKFKQVFLSLIVVILTVISGLMCLPAYADSTSYSDVLNDLQKDETFKASEYPAKASDFSLSVIQIAESVNGELFIYVYQPAAQTHDLRATSINISTAINDSLSYHNYKLNLINSSGVFYKYAVAAFEVKKDALRYYDITSIFRAWNKDIDTGTGNDNEINEVSSEVGQLWAASTVGDVVSYNMTVSETVLVTDKYVDFLRYPDGLDYFGNKWSSCDSHYIAFNTDYRIDELYSADVFFVAQSSYFNLNKGITTFGDKVNNYVTLTYTDIVSNSGNQLWGQKYVWNRIEKVSDFVAKEELTDETKKQLNGKQWVLRFYESDFKQQYSGNAANGTFNIETYSTYVSEVTILRLNFKSNGKVYNLGVVDNKQTGDDKPGNEIKSPGFWQFLWNCIVKTFTGAGAWWQIAITVVVIVVAFLVVCLVVRLIRFAIDSLREKNRYD